MALIDICKMPPFINGVTFCSLSAAQKALWTPNEIKHVISIGSVDENPPRGLCIGRDDNHVLRLVFDDFEHDSIHAPRLEDIHKIVEFCTRHAEGDMLIHCYAGHSRSAAAAHIALECRGRRGSEIYKINPTCKPNRLMMYLYKELKRNDEH